MQLHERRGATTQFGTLEGQPKVRLSFCEIEGQLQVIMPGVIEVVWNLKRVAVRRIQRYDSSNVMGWI
jgi:hypothetical protein